MAFVVNPKGAVHSVPDEWLSDLRAKGYREATADEIAHWYIDQGLEPPDAGKHGASRSKAHGAAAD